MLQNRSVLRRVGRLFIADAEVKCFFRAGADAVTATDTLHAVRFFGRIDIHLAGMRAGAAVDALALVEVHADEGEAVEESVEGA